MDEGERRDLGPVEPFEEPPPRSPEPAWLRAAIVVAVLAIVVVAVWLVDLLVAYAADWLGALSQSLFGT